MAEEIVIVAEPRTEQGKGASGRLRRDGILPAIVYGQGKQAQTLQLNEHDFEQLLKHHHSEHLIVDLKIGNDKAKKVLLKGVQHHPVSGRILHADFHEISMKQKLRVSIAIELVGEPEGVTQQGGVLEHLLREVDVECLPMDLVEEFTVDVSELKIGDSLDVGDIDIDRTKYHILTNKGVAIASVSAPRVSAEGEEEVAAVEEGAAAAEPERIGETKDEAEEEA